MLDGTVPKSVKPFKLAASKAKITGKLPIGSLERVQDLLAKHDGELDISMQFGIDLEGTSFVKGVLKGNVALICQRCMQEYGEPIHSTFALAPVTSDNQAKDLSEDYEPWIVASAGSAASLYEMLEDELLLALPVIARHAEGECPNESLKLGEL